MFYVAIEITMKQGINLVYLDGLCDLAMSLKNMESVPKYLKPTLFLTSNTSQNY